jgi:hypothetical protein
MLSIFSGKLHTSNKRVETQFSELNISSNFVKIVELKWILFALLAALNSGTKNTKFGLTFPNIKQRKNSYSCSQSCCKTRGHKSHVMATLGETFMTLARRSIHLFCG